MKTILVTGAAGFIGSHVSRQLTALGHKVVGIDNLNDYYDPTLKKSRLAWITNERFEFIEMDVANEAKLMTLFSSHHFDGVIHLAAQVGIRYSLTHPHAYTHSNIEGFLSVLECCRKHPIKHLVYASSSSVYGNSKNAPFSETDAAIAPVSLYAASKRANELMAHSYAHLYGIKTTGLRFFTVYGPWGRPDMAPMLFANSLFKREPIKVFNYGHYLRDFTYIDDIVEGILAIYARPPQLADIFNIGNSNPIMLLDFLQLFEDITGIKPELNLLPPQAGDVDLTHADVSKLKSYTGFAPKTPIKRGLTEFLTWYQKYYEIPGLSKGADSSIGQSI